MMWCGDCFVAQAQIGVFEHLGSALEPHQTLTGKTQVSARKLRAVSRMGLPKHLSMHQDRSSLADCVLQSRGAATAVRACRVTWTACLGALCNCARFGAAGGSTRKVESELARCNVTTIASNEKLYAALCSNGGVVAWGKYWGADDYGGDTSPVKVKAELARCNVIKIVSSSRAYAALCSNGRVVAWGNAFAGGDTSTVEAELAQCNVVTIFSNPWSFVALCSNGRMVAWPTKAQSLRGGDTSRVKSKLKHCNVTTISSNGEEEPTRGPGGSYTALCSDGTVVAWGKPGFGGLISTSNSEELEKCNVTAIYSSRQAYAALCSNDGVVAWGGSFYGGDTSPVKSHLASCIVTEIFSNGYVFVALCSNHKNVAWGKYTYFADTGRLMKLQTELAQCKVETVPADLMPVPADAIYLSCNLISSSK